MNINDLPAKKIAAMKELADFVITEYYSRYNISQLYSADYHHDIQEVFEEEQKFPHSEIFFAKDRNSNIIGSIRVFKWDLKQRLPLEKVYSLKASDFLQGKSDVYHIGRFAIKQNEVNTGMTIFKTLMAYAINEVCKEEDAVALAECDSKLLRVLRLLNIEGEELAPAKFYLESDAIPVLLSYRGLKNYLDRNRHLLYHQADDLPDVVVFTGKA